MISEPMGTSVGFVDPAISSLAQSTICRVWEQLRYSPEWEEWGHVVPDLADLDVAVMFEDRPRQRHLLKARSLTYYVPSSEVLAAEGMRNLEHFAAEVYRGLWAQFANKRDLPEPPAIADPFDLPSKLP